MLVDASVARSFAVVGWTRHLLQLSGGTILVADGVHGADPDDPSELRRIRRALQRQADDAGLGSGRSSRALSAVQGLDELLTLDSGKLTVLTLNGDEVELAVRLQSRRPEDRAWRFSLGAKARRLDAGESASIAIAVSRSLPFASDDDDALTLWEAGDRSGDLRPQTRGLGDTTSEAAASQWVPDRPEIARRLSAVAVRTPPRGPKTFSGHPQSSGRH